MSIKRFNLSVIFFFLLATTLFAQMREYYPNSIQGKKERELKTELHNLIMVHERIPYGSAYGSTWTVFRQSDVRSDGSIWDMYSNNTRYFPGGTTGSNREMNIEHSAPKSWWGEGTNSREFKYDASFDLHHLVPSDASANSAKYNYILGEVVNNVTFDNGVSKVGNAEVNDHYSLAFEPADEYKGDFARMYFYLVTCYQGEDIRGNRYTWRSEGLKMFQNTEYPSLTTYGKELLLKWSRQDPVSKKEKDRNNAVYSFQKNRNPFIDYPELVEYIWGAKTTVPFYFSDARITNWASGDYVSMPVTIAGDAISEELTIKGELIEGNLALALDGADKDFFKLKSTSLSADAVNSGANVEIVYYPLKAGFHRATLTLAEGNLSETVVLQLRGISQPASVERVIPVGLLSSYSITDTPVVLQLNSDMKVTWAGDGVNQEGGVYKFSPKDAGTGMHSLKWSAADGSAGGSVLIVVK